MSGIKSLATKIGIPVALALPALNSLAQVRPEDIQPETQYTKTDLVDTITTFANYILGLVAVIAVIMIIYGGFLYITAGTDEENLKKAKTVLIYGIIGVIIAILAFAIISFAASFLA